jgi:predicted acetyltransferase
MQLDRLDISLARTGEHALLAQILADSFGRVSDALSRSQRADADVRVRVARCAGRPVGLVCERAARIAFQTHWVDAKTLSCVAVDASWRRRGIATELVRASVRALHAEGVALAALVPTQSGPYERAGFRVAGARWLTHIRVHALQPCASHGRVRAYAASDQSQMLRVARETGCLRNGAIELDALRVGELARAPRRTWVVEVRGRIEGFVVFSRSRSLQGLRVLALCASSPAAATSLWARLFRRAGPGAEICTRLAPADPLLAVLSTRHVRHEERGAWMLRVVDVQRALSQRALPEDGSLPVLMIEDDELGPSTWNARADREARPLGAVRVALPELNELYSAARRADELAKRGRIHASNSQIAALDACFAAHPASLTAQA